MMSEKQYKVARGGGKGADKDGSTLALPTYGG